MNNFRTGKDLTKEAPRSPKITVGGFNILGRTIDKCRAKLWGNIGEYHFDCPLDNMLFGFKGIKGEDFKTFVEEGHTDEEIASWVRASGIAKTDGEIQQWNKEVEADNYSNAAPGKKQWLMGESKRLGLPENSTLFAFLEADDIESFKKH